MNKLDLHGTKHEDVRNKVIRFIEDNWSHGTEVEVITGNSGKMLDLVLDVVREYELGFRFGDYYSLIKNRVFIFME